MKRIILSAAIMAIIAASCKKSELDLYPYNAEETSQAFNTQSDVTLAVNGMYYGLRAGAYWVTSTTTFNLIPDVLADNLIISQAGRLTQKTFGEWRYQANNTIGFFNAAYTMVRRANAVLENIDRFPAGAFHDNAKGEALAVRALVYFDLSRLYGKTYQNASATDSIAPYVTSTDATILPSREPVQGFYDKLLADLSAAYPLINASNGTGRMNKAAVAALQSRVNLYKGDYAACITSSNNALGATPVLPDIATFPKIWTDDSEQGVLFKIIDNAIDNVNAQGVNYSQPIGGVPKSEYVVTYDFKQLFQANDVRTSTYIQVSAYLGNTYNNVKKYNGGTGKPTGVQDAKVLRTAEVLLNRMEAYARSGNDAAALADLVLLKKNRYTGYVPEVLAGTALLNEILLQRRLELAFEGDRFFDLKRRNLPVQRDPVHGDRADGTGTPFVFTTLAVGDFRFQLPYPSQEINFNFNLKQNPGY